MKTYWKYVLGVAGLMCGLSLLNACSTPEREMTPSEVVLETARQCRVYDIVYSSNGSFAGRISCHIDGQQWERKTR